jgi:polyhydroxyalkanoate synthesis repressor PhaR
MAENTVRAEAAVETPQQPVVVKKYANRRLYNTESSSYVTLDDLAGMVRQGRDFIVFDAKSGDDITRSVLTQIIVEEESKGRSLLPESFLRQLIGFYGDSLQGVLPRYLEYAMSGFSRQQEQMKRSMEQAIGGFLPFPTIEEVSKQNMAMLERAMSLFAPFRPHDSTQTVELLRAEVDELRAALAEAQRKLK